MRVVKASDLEWKGYASGPRGGGLVFKTLLTGQEGTLDNYIWVIAKGDGARYSPRHRHNFDQVRFALQGDVSIGERKSIKEGEIGYFPEGTHYGPQDDAGAQRTTLVLQFAGASGQGFLSRRQVAAATEELKKYGTFEKGIYHRTDGQGRKNQDGFEAAWELVNGRKLEYPKRRYEEPVILDPKNFSWRPSGQDGVSRKLLGMFTERETRLEVYRVDAKATWIAPAENSVGLTFVCEGAGTCCGNEFETHTAIEAAPGDKLEIKASQLTEFLRIVIPSYIGQSALQAVA